MVQHKEDPPSKGQAVTGKGQPGRSNLDSSAAHKLITLQGSSTGSVGSTGSTDS
ncbi:hypothetical protein MM213_11565 [Belliella sp. R4-6]|uniref:Uncharacterized protein n=1 Tax=Belliella alkalica TaxID=1730871 RepID=A0ABS9VE08_9BACT|nr:hypothetical protein [Belliella alkalica]MCH7414128.1 hypothetical protein [Belliella alkalica]